MMWNFKEFCSSRIAETRHPDHLNWRLERSEDCQQNYNLASNRHEARVGRATIRDQCPESLCRAYHRQRISIAKNKNALGTLRKVRTAIELPPTCEVYQRGCHIMGSFRFQIRFGYPLPGRLVPSIKLIRRPRRAPTV